jgi:hypothetical protein
MFPPPAARTIRSHVEPFDRCFRDHIRQMHGIALEDGFSLLHNPARDLFAATAVSAARVAVAQSPAQPAQSGELAANRFRSYSA